MKVSLITGVSRKEGLGFETAKQLLALNYTVIISGRDEFKVKELAKEINSDYVVLDITSEESINGAVGQLLKKYGKLDVLINNAGSYFDAGTEPLSADIEFAKQAFDTNLFGSWRIIKAFTPILERSDCGRIVNVSSGAGSFTDPVFGLSVHPGIVPVYSLTKLALNGLTVKLAKQFSNSAIKINSICPGFVATYPGTAEWGARPVSEGAKGIVWAATLPADGPTGGFFRDGKKIDW